MRKAVPLFYTYFTEDSEKYSHLAPSVIELTRANFSATAPEN